MILVVASVNLSDAELVYLYQENYQNNSALLRLMLHRYQTLLTRVQAYLYRRFFYLPFALSDLNWLQYQVVAKAVANFSPHYNKTFKNYLLALFNWRIKNEIRSCWSKKTATTSQTLPLKEANLNRLNIVPNTDHHRGGYDRLDRCVLDYCIKLLTPIEQKTIQMRLDGYSIGEIMHEMDINYRQVDNAIQRSVRKLKCMVNKNWLK